jgi:hypothetical protein
VVNEAPRHEDLWMSGGIASRILKLGNRCGQLWTGRRIGGRADLDVLVISGGGLIYNAASNRIIQGQMVESEKKN